MAVRWSSLHVPKFLAHDFWLTRAQQPANPLKFGKLAELLGSQLQARDRRASALAEERI